MNEVMTLNNTPYGRHVREISLYPEYLRSIITCFEIKRRSHVGKRHHSLP